MPERFQLPRITLVSWREWLGVCAAVLAVVSSFLNWTILSSGNPAAAQQLSAMSYESTHRDAWSSGIYAWIPLLLTVVTCLVVAVLGQFRSIRRAGLPQLWLVAGVVVVALSVIGLFAMRGQFGTQAAALLAELGVEASAGIGRWLGLAAAVLTLLAAALDARALRTERRKPARRSRAASRR